MALGEGVAQTSHQLSVFQNTICLSFCKYRADAFANREAFLHPQFDSQAVAAGSQAPVQPAPSEGTASPPPDNGAI